MKRQSRLLEIVAKEEGFALVAGLLITLVLSIVAVGVIGTGTLEMKIAGNEKAYTINLYQAEAAALTGAQEIENDTTKTFKTPGAVPWLNTQTALPGDVTHPEEDDNWITGTTAAVANIVGDAPADPDINKMSLFHGIEPGYSAKAGNKRTNVYTFGMLGESKKMQSRVVVEIGYRTVI